MSFGKVESRSSSPLSIGPQERIAYRGDLRPLLEVVTTSHDFGGYVGHEVKENGYEDFNLVLETQKGKFFIKCFANWRSEEDCRRYIDMIQAADKIGKVTTPFIYQNQQDSALTTISVDGATVHLCAMKYLDGGNVWESGRPLSAKELAQVLHEAGKIAKCDYRPTEVVDSWAIVNAQTTYDKNKERIDPTQRAVVEDLLRQLKSVDVKALPHAFVHADIRSTNVMRHSDGNLYVIDFSVANWYPRILELAVLSSDLLFNGEKSEEFQHKYPWALSEYQKSGISLTSTELETLPLFVRLAHAMNVIGASSVEATNYISQEENKYWLSLGKKGLRWSTTNWGPDR